MKKIKLTQGKYALVDNSDFELLNQWKWNYSSGYARRIQEKNGKRSIIYMHRLLMGNVRSILIKTVVDHINRNKLDNRKNNLRICTQFQNTHNHGINKNNTSGFKGVSWSKNINRWHASIWLKRKNIHIGYFKNKKTAAKAYDEFSKRLHKEFGRLNFI